MPDMLRWLWRDHPVSTDPNDARERSFNEPVKSADFTETADGSGHKAHEVHKDHQETLFTKCFVILVIFVVFEVP